MTAPTAGDMVKWSTHPERQGPHRYTFGRVVDVADPVVWELILPDGSTRYVVPHILEKTPGRHLAK